MQFRHACVFFLLMFYLIDGSYAQTSEEWFIKGKESTTNEEKIKNFNKAIAKNPKHAIAYFYRAIARYELDLLKEAMEDMYMASDYHSNIFLAELTYLDYFNKINLGLIELYGELIRKEPKNPENYFERGLCQYQFLQLKKAIKDFSKAIKLDPKNHRFYYYRGRARGISDHELALKDYNQAIDLYPDDPYYFLKRGRLNHDLENHAASVEDFDKAMQMGIVEEIIYYERGKSLYIMGEYDRALVDFEKYLKYKPNNSEILELKKSIKQWAEVR